MKIYRTTDRVQVKIDDVVLTIAPLTQAQKLEVQSMMMKGRATGDIETVTKGIVKAVKYAVKDLKGITDQQGNAYTLTKEGDNLTDDCAEELLNIESSEKLVLVCTSLASGFTTKFTDEKGAALVGVEVIESGEPKKT